MAKRGRPPKNLWNLVQIAGYLDFEDPAFYEWIIEARNRDTDIRCQFSDAEWQDVVSYIGGLVFVPGGRRTVIVSQPDKPENWSVLWAKLIGAGLLPADLADQPDARQWGPLVDYARWLAWSAKPVRNTDTSRLLAFGSIGIAELNGIAPFGPDAEDTLADLLRRENVFPNYQGLYQAKFIKDKAKFRGAGRPPVLSSQYRKDTPRFNVRRAQTVASFMVDNDPVSIVELLDKYDEISAAQRCVNAARKGLTGQRRAMAEIKQQASSNTSLSDVHRLSKKIDVIEANIEKLTREERQWRETLKGSLAAVSALRSASEDRLAAFNEAWFGPTEKKVTSARTNSRFETLLRPSFGLAYGKLRDGHFMNDYEALWDALDAVGEPQLTEDQRAWVRDYEQNYDRILQAKRQEVSDRLDKWRHAFWGRGRVVSPHMPTPEELLSFIDGLLLARKPSPV